MDISRREASRAISAMLAMWTAAPAVSRVIAQIAPLMGLMPKTVTPSPVMAGAGSITIKGSKEVAAVE